MKARGPEVWALAEALREKTGVDYFMPAVKVVQRCDVLAEAFGSEFEDVYDLATLALIGDESMEPYGISLPSGSVSDRVAAFLQQSEVVAGAA